jgi:hypothetical protein
MLKILCGGGKPKALPLVNVVEQINQSVALQSPICFYTRGKATRWIGVNPDRIYPVLHAFDQGGSTSAERVDHCVTAPELKLVD